MSKWSLLTILFVTRINNEPNGQIQARACTKGSSLTITIFTSCYFVSMCFQISISVRIGDSPTFTEGSMTLSFQWNNFKIAPQHFLLDCDFPALAFYFLSIAVESAQENIFFANVAFLSMLCA